MRSFESPSPKGAKPEIKENNPPLQPAAGQASTGRAGGHTYRRRPTPSGAAGGATPPVGERMYYSKKRNGGTPSGGGAAAKQSRFTNKQMRLNIMLGSLVLVLILSLVLAALLPGCQQARAAGSSVAGSSEAISRQVESYDKDELAIPEGEYAGIILDETEDAGEEYVEETLFIGDSNTERMIQYGDITGVSMKNGIGIASMGIGSVTGLKCVRFSGYNDMTIPQAVQVMQPRRIVIMFGTNNVGMYTETFISQYEYALEAIEEYWPYADIIIGSILPIAENCTYGSLSQKAVDEFNLALVEMAKAHDYKFLNWSEAVKDTKTGYAKKGALIGDGVHIAADGVEALFDYFRTHSYITDDARPKPLKTVPTRLPTPEGLFPKPESSSSSASASGSGSDSDVSRSASGSSGSSSSSQVVSSSVPVAPSSQAPVSITVSVVAGEGGSVTGGSATGTAGASVTLTGVTATPNPGYVFEGWTGGASSPEAGKLTVYIPPEQTGNLVITAIFTAVASEGGTSPATDVAQGAG